MEHAFLLRPYQEECIEAVLASHQREGSRVVAEMPPGAGKTVTGAEVLRQLLHPKEYGLFVVPFLELVDQTYKELTAHAFSPWDVGIVQGKRNQVGRHITIASADTLEQPERLRQVLEAQRRPFSAAIYDECHRSLCPSYERIGTALSPYALLLGMSATPYRSDRRSLLHIFPHDIVYSVSFFDLIMAGHLTSIHSYDVETSLDLTSGEVEDLDEEGIKQLSPALRKKLEATNRYARAYEVWHEMTKRQKRTLIFAQDLSDAYAFMEYFQRQGVPSDIITGKMGPDHRKDILRKFRSKETIALFNYNVLSTGVDIPEVECIIIGRLMSQGPWTQVAGRGTRLCPEIGKTECLLLNLVDRHHTLMTMGRLIGVESDSIPSLRRALAEKVEEETETVVIEEKERKAFSFSVKVAEVRAKAYNILCGDGWTVSEVTGDFTKDCGTYGTLEALRTFVGYSVKHISKGGQIRWLSRDPIDAWRARAMAHEYIERKRLTGEKRAGKGIDPKAKITESHWQFLKQRRVGYVGKTYKEGVERGLLERHYWFAENHLHTHGAAHTATGGTVSYDMQRHEMRVIPPAAPKFHQD